jgi:hypothetical protein
VSAHAYSYTVPVLNAENAISIAKEECRGKAGPNAKWEAYFDKKIQQWNVDTAGDNTNWGVTIPIAGPPTLCIASFNIRIVPLARITTAKNGCILWNGHKMTCAQYGHHVQVAHDRGTRMNTHMAIECEPRNPHYLGCPIKPQP